MTRPLSRIRSTTSASPLGWGARATPPPVPLVVRAVVAMSLPPYFERPRADDLERDEPLFDEPRLDVPLFDEPLFDEPRLEEDRLLEDDRPREDDRPLEDDRLLDDPLLRPRLR